MVAVGKGGKILSRDCDLIIADDIEDHGTTIQPSSREQTKRWWTTTLSSRKEEHTAIVVIGSRQHPDDLYNSLIDNDEWHKIIESAHSLDIPIDSGEPKDHKKNICCGQAKEVTSGSWHKEETHKQLVVLQYLRWYILIDHFQKGCRCLR